MPSKLSEADLMKVAQAVHEAVRAWQAANAQAASPAWSRAPRWMKDATAAAITFRLANPKASASAQHDQWAAEKKAGGWKFGAVKDGVKKTHPLLIPYSKLPLVERRKDALVAGVIDALTGPMR